MLGDATGDLAQPPLMHVSGEAIHHDDETEGDHEESEPKHRDGDLLCRGGLLVGVDHGVHQRRHHTEVRHAEGRELGNALGHNPAGEYAQAADPRRHSRQRSRLNEAKLWLTGDHRLQRAPGLSKAPLGGRSS
ncbi:MULTISPECIES: hypothetical protein [Microbacterium]|uniref:hypothetical protein n=1 Tax=Microbacterium TaxID=33882 RepID=UPI00248DCB17|nr:hypothetical protein [Microbacterium aurum]MBZ6371353.1 hypothetical protein [Microbacterium hominis]